MGEQETLDLDEKRRPMEVDSESETEDAEESSGEGRGMQTPLHRWVMHGAVMFGREYCYAMETALVVPVLLQIGLPEQYYSLTWFLSPIFGLILTPVMGSASDRCTLRWGRRRPFILALCVGVLLGMAMFLNGSLIGLSIGDRPGSQPVGIILTVLGVMVLDFSADACDGPIRAYLLDVADTEEQDMALNIHAFSAGLGGALGYMLGGLDWTGTSLGQAFKSQQQVLFLFTAIIFIISVILHMFSIPEKQFVASQQFNIKGRRTSASQSSYRRVSHTPQLLDVIAEEDPPFGENHQSDPKVEEMDFLIMERMRSKSDSVLAMPDTTINLDPDLDLQIQLFLSELHQALPEIQEGLKDSFKPSKQSIGSLSPGGPPKPADRIVVVESGDSFSEPNGQINGPPEVSPASDGSHMKPKTKLANGAGVNAGLSSTEHCNANKSHTSSKTVTRLLSATSSPRPHKHTFYRQPSFTFSYYGRVGSQRHRLRRTTTSSPPPITTSRSLNDLSDLQMIADRREFQLSESSLSSVDSSSDDGPNRGTTVRLLWLSMLKMPKPLWRLCVCHLVTWFSYLAQAVFYTDFMGQVIFHGDPKALANSTEFQNYNSGVQMGCWGLVVNAATAAVCSAILQKYLDNFDLSIKVIYIMGTLGFAIGTAAMAIFPNVYVAMVMISSMGIISMSMSYCPYALLGQYHEIKEYIHHSPANSRRGFGIDCAILSCHVYISQILVASALGAVIKAVGSVRVIPMVASGSSFLGFLVACFLVIYPDEDSKDQELACLSLELDQNGEEGGERLALQKMADRDGLKNTETQPVA
ncbi:solute carrier family 45 member 4-like isoform X1 [Phyllopteryx taeniolatus]|uniref:solute carrier family 45 member 4-like isoform X1 n=2 Tax=Phyllopteryx taeniolatus TaxID=161469 RepID=UPI002AD1ED99|nr:solute carrier family 45 member 4-like isoform X1 [Phyllopteryx taeniolatus]XP_061633484.1 solute carrier family 45 member 4-like isoform X1 [Phyllopteryx taeniolatus]